MSAKRKGKRRSGENLAAKREARLRREEKARRARRRRQLRRTAAIATVVAAALATAGWLVYQDFRADAELEAALTAGSYIYDEEADDGRDHVSDPHYQVNPPAGGAHLANPSPAGTYTGESVPPTGFAFAGTWPGDPVVPARRGLSRARQAASAHGPLSRRCAPGRTRRHAGARCGNGVAPTATRR